MRNLSQSYIIDLLKAWGDKQKDLHAMAVTVRNKALSNHVYLRGLIEFSNVCKNDCFYCGIRRSNQDVVRYTMSKDEIMQAVKICDHEDYGSVVLQSGERNDAPFIDFVEDVVQTIKQDFPHIGITLCVGEQTKETYKRFYEAGAHRYLLRIESSDPSLYSRLHPDEMSFKHRKQCLNQIRETGFQTGTGMLIGAPFQTLEHLANDLIFMQKMDIDMVGMGPYIPHPNTPLETTGYNRIEAFNLGLNMIALLRLMMPDINIASTTALEALHSGGKEAGLMAGANVIMPLLTPAKYTGNYNLYKDKPITTVSKKVLNESLSKIKMKPCFGKWGDSKHFFERKRMK